MIPPSLSSKHQTCSKPINLYREGKLQRVDEGDVNMNLCPVKQTSDGQSVQTILKLIQRSASITSCPGRASNAGEPRIFVCRFPDCMPNPCPHSSSCVETEDSFDCVNHEVTEVTGNTVTAALPTYIPGSSAKATEYVTTDKPATEVLEVQDTTAAPTTSLSDKESAHTTYIPGSSAMATESMTTDKPTNEVLGVEDTTAAPTTSLPYTECSHTNTQCQQGWDIFGRKCYMYVSMDENWKWHSDNCKDNYSATMLVIESSEENDFIRHAYGNNRRDIWLGCFQQTNLTYWFCPKTGAKWFNTWDTMNTGYWNWTPGEPNEDSGPTKACLRVFFSEDSYFSRWRDRECETFSYRSVCQKDLK
nr:uncharacterized protein LOC129258676 [Lytechinus pictus]